MSELDTENVPSPAEHQAGSVGNGDFDFSDMMESPVAKHSGFKIGQLLIGQGAKVLDIDFETCSQLGCNYLETLKLLESKKLMWADLFSLQVAEEIAELDFDTILKEGSNVEFEALKVVSASGVSLFVNISIWTIDDASGKFAVVLISDARRKSYFDNMQKLALSDLISDYASSLMWSCKPQIDRMDSVASKSFELLFFEMANIDVVTNLPNRRMYLNVLNQIISDSIELGSDDPVGVALLKVNNLKAVNEKRGLAQGDALLAKVGSKLKAVMRTSDLVARVDGSQFAIALPGVKAHENLSIVAKRILNHFNDADALDQDGLATVSMGLCLFPEAGETVSSLMQNATHALDKAKKLKANKFKVYAPKG